jgi:hypothetical protein
MTVERQPQCIRCPDAGGIAAGGLRPSHDPIRRGNSGVAASLPTVQKSP